MLNKRNKVALRAFRTAEFFAFPDTQLPQGLDASPPVLYWVKGLEVWLNGLLTGHLAKLANSGKLDRFSPLYGKWSRIRSELAPEWDDRLLPLHGKDLYEPLGKLLVTKLNVAKRVRQNQSIRTLAAVLLVFGERDGYPHMAQWRFGVSRQRVVKLVNALLALAEERNRLAHRKAGDADVNRPVRGLALSCVSTLAAMAPKNPGESPNRSSVGLRR